MATELATLKNLNVKLSKEGTIKSTELTDIINVFREEEGKTDLLHKNFMAKIKNECEELKRVGITPELNFKPGTYKDSNNQERPCFELTRKGMAEMLNSESVYCRAKTLDYID